jgi:hypothetical protein
MRFVEDGPDIPDELLEARDRGEVIFVCGAGISMPAGLPSFLMLAKQVVADLGVSKGHGAHVLLDQIANTNDELQPPIDQVFNRLRKEYGPLVQEAVFKRLKIKKNSSLEKHKLLLDLSTDANGVPRLVTTNFDYLFEMARKGLRKYIAPELPDLNIVPALTGIVYLHGRMLSKRSEQSDTAQIILSSSDFGRAYLAQGWATRFVRDLLQRFTVVLLGYSASDPPIRYLLEGLETSTVENRHRIYAFEAGIQAEVTARWRDRNVRGIGYAKIDDKHSGLWHSIDKWATRAKDSVAWRKATVELANKGPRTLRAFERGQVVSLISSVDGAKAFADAITPPPAEWLYVFDRNQRYAKPYKSRLAEDQDQEFDPQQHYGLDSDPPRVDEQQTGNSRTKQTGADPLASFDYESTPSNYRRLTNLTGRAMAQIPPRLFHMSRWIAKNIADPVTPWWAAKQLTLHPELLNQIDFTLNRLDVPVPPVIRKAWNYILEVLSEIDGDELRYEWYSIADKFKKSGWSPSLLRELELFLLPKLAIEHSVLSDFHPHFPELGQLELKQIVSLKVEFPEFDNGLRQVEDNLLPKMMRFARLGLERGSQLLDEIDRYARETPTLFPQQLEGETYHDARAKYFLWFGSLFERLCKLNPQFAAEEFSQWPDDKLHFDKLKLFALSYAEVFSVRSVVEHLEKMDAEPFWDSGN